MLIVVMMVSKLESCLVLLKTFACHSCCSSESIMFYTNTNDTINVYTPSYMNFNSHVFKEPFF